jgi:5'(3')-deoxyribonucleotidase
MTAVAAVALRPNELNSNAIEQQKEKWAKRDYFVDHAMKDIEKLKGNPVRFIFRFSLSPSRCFMRLVDVENSERRRITRGLFN